MTEYYYSKDHVNELRDRIMQLKAENEMLKARLGEANQRIFDLEIITPYDTHVETDTVTYPYK